MKNVVVLFLFIAFAFRPVYNVGYVMYYKLNVDYIIETYCVNKEKPQLQCNGQCHLIKQLSIVDAKDAITNERTSIIDAFFPIYFQYNELLQFGHKRSVKKNKIVSFQHFKETIHLLSSKPPPRLCS